MHSFDLLVLRAIFRDIYIVNWRFGVRVCSDIETLYFEIGRVDYSCAEEKPNWGVRNGISLRRKIFIEFKCTSLCSSCALPSGRFLSWMVGISENFSMVSWLLVELEPGEGFWWQHWCLCWWWRFWYHWYIYIYIAQDDFDLSVHEGFSTLDIDLVKLPKRIKLKEKQNYPLLLIKMKVGLLMVRVEFHFWLLYNEVCFLCYLTTSSYLTRKYV